MSDIAVLGIKVDTTQVNAATAALDKLAPAAAKAERGAQGLEKATGRARDEAGRFVKQSDGLTKATDAAAKAQERLQQSTRKTGDEAAKLAKHVGLARHEMINLSRQAQDVAVSLGSGQSPFTVLLQQGTQIGDIFAASKGTVRGFAGQMAGMITPARALGLGVGVLGAATYAAYAHWRDFAKQLDDTARIAGVTSQAMSKLQGAAGFKGIDAEEFQKGVAGIASSIYQARTGAGDLATLFRANGVAAKGFTDYLTKGADLIKNAESDQQRLMLLQQMGLPATMQWVRFMSQGGDAIRKAASEMTGLNSQSDAMLAKQRQMDEAWNRFWTKAGETARNTFVTVISGLGQFIADMNKGFNQVKPPPMGTQLRVTADGPTTGASKPTVDPNELQRLNALEQQRLGILGQMLSVQDQVRQVELQVAAARLAGVRVTSAEAENLKRLARERALGTDQIQAQVDALRAQAQTYGLSAGQAAAYLVSQAAIDERIRAGQPYRNEEIEQIRQKAAELGRLVDQQRSAAEYANLAMTGLNSFADGLIAGKSAAESFRGALAGIGKEMQNLASQSLSRSLTGLFSGRGLSLDFGSLAMGGIGMLLQGITGRSEQRRRAEQERIREQQEAEERGWRLSGRLGTAQGDEAGEFDRDDASEKPANDNTPIIPAKEKAA